MTLAGKKVLIVGGSSGIGFAAAQAALQSGASVVIASRSAEKLREAAARLGNGAETRSLDTSDESAVQSFFEVEGAFDHIVVSAAQTKVAPVRELPLQDAYESMNSKFWGAYRVARAASIADGGSLTLVSGFLSVRPRKGTAIQGAINAAVEGLTRGLALELAPIRVNCVSPGLVLTEMYDGLSADARHAMVERAANHLPVGRVASPADIAVQIIALLLNPFMTGSTVFVDGGASLA